jgi:hypothetical protein
VQAADKPLFFFREQVFAGWRTSTLDAVSSKWTGKAERDLLIQVFYRESGLRAESV